MKQEIFNESMRTGEFEKMFKDNRIGELLNSGDLSKEQIDLLIQLGKNISKTELEKRQNDLASQPGYEEYILSPMVAKILGTKTKKTKSVPEKTVEKTKKMKEKFDPGNLGKAFKKTSTSSMATKQPKEDTVITEKKPAQPKLGSINAGLYASIASTKISKLRKGDSVSTIATKIYTVFKTDMEERKQKSELARNFGVEKLDNERRRHKELLDAIEKAKKKQPRVPVRDPKTGRYVKTEPIRPGAPSPKPVEVPVGKGPPSQPAPAPKKAEAPAKPAEVPKKAEAPAKPSEVPAKPAEVPKKAEAPAKPSKPSGVSEAEKKAAEKAAKEVEAPKPTATKPPPAPATAPTTTPVRPNLPSQGRTATPLSKMPPLAAGVIFAGTVGAAIAGRMAERESAGNKPDSYFLANFVSGRDTPGTKTTLGSNKIVKGNIDITTGQPFTKSLNEMTIAEVVELAQRRSKFFGKAGAGAAMGKYQFMPDTLRGHATKLFGPWAMYQPFSEENQELLQQSLMRGNAKLLMGDKLPITDSNLYLLHFFGNATQASMVINGKDSDSMGTILDYFWERRDADYKSKYKRPSVANPGIAKMTVGEYKRSHLLKSFNMKEITFEELTKDINISTPTGRTEDYKKILMNNKENGKNDNVNVNINAPTTVINKQNPKQSISKPTSADKPAIAGIP